MILGIRPESFEDASYAPADLPGIDVAVVVLEELGSDAHVFFRVDAPRIAPEVLEAEGEGDGVLVAEPNALLNARVDPRTTGTRRDSATSRGGSNQVPFLRPRHGREPAPRLASARPEAVGCHCHRLGVPAEVRY